jgi:hypothetical protein
MHPRLILSFLLVLVFKVISAQVIVTDTVRVRFVPDSVIPTNYFWNSVTDNRGGNLKLVGYSEKKKYVLLPVDQELCVQNNLSEIIGNNKYAKFSSDTFALEIEYFIIEPYNGRFINPHVLYADMPIFKIKNGEKQQLGVITYNFEYKPINSKLKIPQASEQVLANWHRQFKIDMISVVDYANTGMNKPDILLTSEQHKPYYFNIILNSSAGINFWQIEGELAFTRPETSISRWFTGSFLRYQNTPEFEMVGFGKKAEHYSMRLSDKTAFDFSTNMVLGLNKWRNIKEIKLWQIMQISASSTQSFNFEKKNQSGWLLKAGLYENLYYIVQKPLGFQFGPYLAVGYKF